MNNSEADLMMTVLGLDPKELETAAHQAQIDAHGGIGQKLASENFLEFKKAALLRAAFEYLRAVQLKILIHSK
jgi:hypothetical protein